MNNGAEHYVTSVGAGGAGAATGSVKTTRSYAGRLLGIGFKYNTCPVTTVMTVTCNPGGGAPAKTIGTVTGNADGWFEFAELLSNPASGADIAAEYDRAAVIGEVSFVMTLANDGSTVDCWLVVE